MPLLNHPKSKDFPRRVEQAVERIRAGNGIVFIQYPNSSIGHIIYRARDSRTIRPNIVAYLIQIGRLTSGRDGLLEDKPQTLRYVPR